MIGRRSGGWVPALRGFAAAAGMRDIDRHFMFLIPAEAQRRAAERMKGDDGMFSYAESKAGNCLAEAPAGPRSGPAPSSATVERKSMQREPYPYAAVEDSLERHLGDHSRRSRAISSRSSARPTHASR